jgi:hypothetical protein
MPGVEDFGMVPVEAQACGRPVVALAQGGALESVVEGVTGILVPDPSVEAFAAALSDVSTRDFDTAAIRRHAESFGKARFQDQFRAVVSAANDSERRSADQDPGEISVKPMANPNVVSNAARYAPRRGGSAAREDKP